MAACDTNLVGDNGQLLSAGDVKLTPVGSTGKQVTLRQIASFANAPLFTGGTLALLGDSISANNGVDYQGAIYPPLGGYRTTPAKGYANWLCALSKQQLQLEPNYNRSVSGRTSTQILAALPEVIRLNPAWCVVECGTNDNGNGLSPQTTVANLTSIYQGLTAHGIRIIAIPVTPRTAPNGNTTQGNIAVTYINQFIRRYAHLNGNIVIADPRLSAIINVATGAPATGMTLDGLHPNEQGAYYWGTVLWNAVKQYFQNGDMGPVCYDANEVYDPVYNVNGNILTNSLFTTATGGTLNGASLLTGSVPSGWTATMTKADTSYTGTIAITNAARTDTPNVEGNWFIVTASSLQGTVTGGPQDHVQLFQQQNMPAGINPGDWVECMCEVDVNATSGFNGFDIDVGMNDGNGVTTFVTGMGPSTNASGWANTAYRVTLRTPRAQVPPINGSSQRIIQGFVNLYFDTTPTTGPATAVVKVASLTVRKVT